MTYRGRFAPSPTGPLHLGSLIAALASFLDARQQGGQWLVRMEDLDPPREQAGAADAILDALSQHGLRWDGPVMFQSERGSAYAEALTQLQAGEHLFECDCTRAMQGPEGNCSGNCSHRQQWVTPPSATRICVPSRWRADFVDRIQGPQHCPLGEKTLDYVVKRKDGLNAYQLAVVVDDAQQGITHVVRGSDLLDATARQIFLQETLQVTTPEYAHIPVITTAAGQKFSKQNHAPALNPAHAVENLQRALRFLQQPPIDSGLTSPEKVLEQAIAHWDIRRVPKCMDIHAAESAIA